MGMNDWHNYANINKAFVESFLSILAQEHRDLYNNTLTQNYNVIFSDISTFLYREYGIRDETELEKLRSIRSKRGISQRDLKFSASLFGERVIFLAFAGNKISAGNILNVLINVIVKTDVFQTQDTNW